MRRVFTISLTREGDLFVAQCLDVDVASQGTTAEEAIDNLREAIELHFEPPAATLVPNLLSIEIEIDAA